MTTTSARPPMARAGDGTRADIAAKTLRTDRLHSRGGALRPVHPGLEDPALGAVEPAVPAAVPAHLLLLPQGVLPVVLAVATGLRRAGRAQALHRRDPLPAGLPERTPVRLLRRVHHLGHQLLRRDRGVPR